MKLKDIKITFPDKIKVTPEMKDEIDRNMIVKKVNKLGFFDDEGKWKEK